MAKGPQFIERLLIDFAAGGPPLKPVTSASNESSALELHEGSASLAVPFTPEHVIARIHEGLPARSFKVLADALAVSSERLARVLQIAPRTLARRKVFKPDESDRILRLGRLFQRTVEVLGNETAAQEWLSKPQWGLGGAIPLDYADTETGAREVEVLLGRMEHGVVA